MKQDRQGVRTAQDLERKYDLAGMEKAVKNSVEGINKTNKTLEDFVNLTLQGFENIETQLDGYISTYYYNGVPTLLNIPASDWDDYESHLDDLYYDKNTGHAYIFTKNNDVYLWERIKDVDIIEALALANSAKDTADGKRRVFTQQPIPPYENGDLWFKDGEIYICQISKEYSPNLYRASDWTFQNCTLNSDGSVTSNFTNHYYSFIRSSLFNDFLMSKRGEKITFSVADNHNKMIAMVIFGTRTSGETWQEVSRVGDYVTATVAEDFTEISYIELRWNRSYSAFTDTTTVVKELQFEEGDRTAYKPYSGYADNDFIIATKYTDDTVAKQVGDNLEIVRGTVTTIQEGVDAFKIEMETTVKSIDELQQETIESMERMSYTFGTNDLVIAKSTDPVNARINNQGLKVYTYQELNAIFNHRGAGVGNLIVVGDAQIGNVSIVKAKDKNGNDCTDINYLLSNVQKLTDLEGD